LLYLTKTFLVEETLMDFGYAYAPNLIHQGASVITEFSSAHGDKNSSSSNSNEVIHGPELISQHSKRSKTIQSSEKLKSALQKLGAPAHARNKNVEGAHMRTMHDC
jgi:hypothetical protein